jgi:hypothetical protein
MSATPEWVALYPDEWAKFLATGDMPLSPDADGPSRYMHGMAAVALHGRPFGFTRADAELIAAAALASERAGQADIAKEFAALFIKVDALLPPPHTSPDRPCPASPLH